MAITPFGLMAQEGAFSCAELQANLQQYQSCATSIPFENSTGNPSGENFNTSCILEPFHGPTWFFMRIKSSGDIFLQISQTNANTGGGADVDFVLWGPFQDLDDICSEINPGSEAACSFSSSAIEDVPIIGATAGDFYILLVDNYESVPGFITITQTGGDGSSDCSFLSAVEILDESGSEITQPDYCKPAVKNLVATVDTSDFPGLPGDLRFSYKWFKDDVEVFSVTDTASPTNTLSVSETGLYRVEMTAYDINEPPIDPTTLEVSTDEIAVSFFETPVVAVSASATCVTASPQLQAEIANTGALPVSYQWFRGTTAIAGATNLTLTATQPGDYTVQVSNAGCGIVTSGIISIYPQPAAVLPAGTTICADESYGIYANVTNTGGLAVSYQWLRDDVEIPGATLDFYTVEAANQPIGSTAGYTVRVTVGGCTAVSNASTVTINAKPELASLPVILEQCDYVSPNNDGLALFDLTQAASAITGNDPDMVLTYFRDAALTDPITDPAFFANMTPFGQVIYVTGTYPGQVPACTSTVATLQLTATPTSVAAYPDLAPVCPVLSEGFGFFDLEAQRSLIKSTYYPTTNVVISFYRNETDASVEANPLDNTSVFTVGIHTLYARIETNNNCEGIGSFTGEVYAAPQENVLPAWEACASDPIVLSSRDAEALAGQQPSVTTSYFSSFANAETNVGAYNKNVPADFPIGTTPIFIRLYDGITGCFSVVGFDLTVYAEPAIAQPVPMSSCGAATAVFDLTSRIAQITGGNPDYTVVFYRSQADFDAGNPIGTPEAHESADATLIVLVTDPTQHNCSSRTSLTLTVTESPGSDENPPILEACDDSGYAPFDLTVFEEDMAGGTPRAEIVFRYYEDLSDAEAGNGAFIPTPSDFTNTAQAYQKIYVRVNSTVDVDSETGIPCHRILEQELFVRKLPQDKLLDTPYHICIDKEGNVIDPAYIDTALTGLYNYSWYKGTGAVEANRLPTNHPYFIAAEAGDYSVKIVDFSHAALCERIIDFTVRTTAVPFSVEGQPAEMIAFETENTVTAVVVPDSEDYEYQLDQNGWQDSNVFTDVKQGLYTLTVRSKYGCGEVSTEIVVADYPRFFTPNGDGVHDYWNIDGEEALEISIVYVFDRNGKLLKSILPNEDGWDGTYNGRPMPSDDYWFKVEYGAGGVRKAFMGHFALKR